jgi:hypothetical protein
MLHNDLSEEMQAFLSQVRAVIEKKMQHHDSPEVYGMSRIIKGV